MTRTDKSLELAIAHSDAMNTHAAVRKNQKLAGKAQHDRAAVKSELDEAIEYFVGGHFMDGDIEEVAKAGRRIGLLCSRLLAADKLPELRRKEEAARSEFARLRGER